MVYCRIPVTCNSSVTLTGPPPPFFYLPSRSFPQDGSQAAYPHWAKWSEAYVAGAPAKLKRAYAGRLPHLERVAAEFDPHGVFVNKYFATLLAP